MTRKDKAKASKRDRKERRFLPHSTSNPLNVKLLGGVGAAVLGAGAWAQFGPLLMGVDRPGFAWAPWLLALGALLFGAAVWLGTSSEPAVRVGSAGVGLEKGALRRMPWHAIERMTWDRDRESLLVKGKDELDKEWALTLTARSHPQAVAWLVKEGRDRVPKVVDVPDEVRGLGKALATEGEALPLDPIRVVGKRCADSGEPILYEPDARVCPKCERVYHKQHVPDSCPCGASLVGLKNPKGTVASDALAGSKETTATEGA